ncbi:hypothetical protein ACS0TY_013463 [Phlomoides rotata]
MYFLWKPRGDWQPYFLRVSDIIHHLDELRKMATHSYTTSYMYFFLICGLLIAY